jgi:hypothetical protein
VVKEKFKNNRGPGDEPRSEMPVPMGEDSGNNDEGDESEEHEEHIRDAIFVDEKIGLIEHEDYIIING